MIFVESYLFDRRRAEFFDDEDYRALQNVLLVNPTSGSLIPETRGLRKIRWAAKGKGKRGGVRVIYYWDRRAHVLFLVVYGKNEQDDLKPKQKPFLMWLVEREYGRHTDAG